MSRNPAAPPPRASSDGTRHLRRLAVALAAVILAALLWEGVSRLRVAAIAAAPLLRSQFAHADHRRTGCAHCHHNFTDGTGTLSCYNCHKKETRSETTRIDTVFHDFCTGCHRTEHAAGLKSGPLRACSACHNEQAAMRTHAF